MLKKKGKSLHLNFDIHCLTKKKLLIHFGQELPCKNKQRKKIFSSHFEKKIFLPSAKKIKKKKKKTFDNISQSFVTFLMNIFLELP